MTQARSSHDDSTSEGQIDAHEELIASLTRINTYNPPVQTCSTGWSFHGLYSGPTSVAYLFFRLSQLYPDLAFKGQSLVDWAQSYLDLGIAGHRDRVDSDHCGIASEVLARLALRAAIEQNPSLVQSLCSYEGIINDPGGSDEWLYGRAGYLYHLRFVQSAFKSDSKATELIYSTIEKTVQRILASQKPWSWHGEQYVGAAHGMFGILTQVVLSSPSSAQSMATMLTTLLETQYSSGNFPASLASDSDRLVQFCHGGPGVVLALRSLRPHFPNLQGKINSAIDSAQQDILKRGLLTKEPCLCHGIPGNALALDDASDFENFLSCMSSEKLESGGWLDKAGRDDQFVGLYTGEAGRAWVWAVRDKDLAEKPCIGFNDL